MHNDSDLTFHCEECEEMRHLVESFPGLVIKLVSLATLATLTTAANLGLIYIACQAKSLVSNTKVFFISLCVAHLLGSLIVIPLWIVTRLYHDFVTSTPVFCQSVAFVWILMILASFYSLSALSLDRFFIISDPMRYPVRATTTKKLIVVAVLWGTCALFAGAPILGWGDYVFEPDAIPICGLNMKSSFSFTVVFIVLGHCVPLIVDIFCCGKIIAIARRQSITIDSRKGSLGSITDSRKGSCESVNSRKGSCDSFDSRKGSSASTSSVMSAMSASSTTVMHPTAKLSKLKQKLNSLRLVFAGTGSFLICWLPYLGAHIWMTKVRNLGHDAQSMPYILEFVVTCVALLNGLLNPLVIMLSNKDYRKRLKIIFRKFRIMKARDVTSEDSRDGNSRSSDTNNRRSLKHKCVSEVFQNISLHPPCINTKDIEFDGNGKVVDVRIETDPVSCVGDNKELAVEQSTHSTLGVVVNVRECRRLLSRTSMSSLSSQESVDEGINRKESTCPNGELGTYMEVPGLVVK